MAWKSLEARRENDRKHYANPAFIERRKAYLKNHYKVKKDVIIARDKRFRARRSVALLEIKKKLSCSVCSENHPATLDFHHNNPNEKVMGVGKMIRLGLSMDRILAEIAKCTVLCSNCHRKETAKQLGWFTGKYGKNQMQ
jgi:hypothetical protein